MREPFSHTWFDYDGTAGVSLPGAYGGTDLSNAGTKDERVNRFLLVTLGGQVQLGPFGASLTSEMLQYDLAAVGPVPGLTLRYARLHALSAYALGGGQVVVGAGARIVFLDVAQAGTGSLITMTGAGPQVGLVVKPSWERWRLGATFRAPVSGQPFGGQQVGAFVTPSRVVQPWELEIGAALQLGPRPLNPPWIDPHDHDEPTERRIEAARRDRQARGASDDVALRIAEDAELRASRERTLSLRKERYAHLPRERVLLLASVLVTGASSEAVALEGFLDQKRQLVGQSATVTPRIGIESEPVADLLVLRIGSYLEPSRFSDVSVRQHFTLGGDLRLFEWDVFGLAPDASWRVTVAGDFAPRYQNLGLSAGLWH